jgi:hypothetical protein
MSLTTFSTSLENDSKHACIQNVISLGAQRISYFYPKPMNKYLSLTPDTSTKDSMRSATLLVTLDSPGGWNISGTFDDKIGDLTGWARDRLNLIEFQTYKVSTVTPGGFTWIPMQARSGLKRRVLWLGETLSRIAMFGQLRAGWDGYGGKTVSDRVRSRAMTVALKLAQIASAAPMSSCETPFVGPLSSGGVLFEIRNRNRELHLSIAPSEIHSFEALKVSTVPSGDEVEEETRISEQNLPEALSWIVLGA